MGWGVVGFNNCTSALSRIKKGDNIKVLDEQLNVEINCIVRDVTFNSLTLTNREAIKTIEIDGKQIPFGYGMIWLEDGSEVYSKEGNFKEPDYYCFEFKSIQESLLLEVSLLSKVGVKAKITTKSGKIIECNFICDSYSCEDGVVYEYELRQQ